MIPVSKPFLPKLDDYLSFLEGIWQRVWLTNNGPLVSDLELKLKNYLNVDHLIFVTNGTIAIQMAIKALNLGGEIITTPFSFVATSSSIVWENCMPVFVDVDKSSLNIDVNKIRAAITRKTTAILATHVYGNPCDVEEIEKIAKEFNLKVIYDAAHAFGVEINGKSIFQYGDISTCSLHSTKLYHSVEGGLVVTKDPLLLKKLAFIRNFGFDGPEKYAELGINCKNSEFHAAMGIVNLKFVDEIIQKRKLLSQRYDRMINGKMFERPSWKSNASMNYSYYPILFENEEMTLKVLHTLERHEIFARRYFYPSLSSSLPYTKNINLPIADNYSRRVLCLPLYYDLSLEEVDLISRLILRTIKN